MSSTPQGVEQLALWIHEHWCDTGYGDWKIFFDGHAPTFRGAWTVSLKDNSEGDYDKSGKAVVYDNRVYQFYGKTLDEVLSQAIYWLKKLMTICSWTGDDDE